MFVLWQKQQDMNWLVIALSKKVARQCFLFGFERSFSCELLLSVFLAAAADALLFSLSSAAFAPLQPQLPPWPIGLFQPFDLPPLQHCGKPHVLLEQHDPPRASGLLEPQLPP